MFGKYLTNIRVFRNIRRLKKYYKMNASEIETLQFNKLQKLVAYAYNAFPFYKMRFDDCGFNPSEFEDIQQFEKIPLLSKQEYRVFCEEVCNSNPKKYSSWYHDGTSGSSGMPLKIIRSWEERAYMISKYMYALKQNSYSILDMTYSLPAARRIQSDSIIQKIGLARRHKVSYTAPTKEMVDGYVNAMPDVLYANKSQLIQMALYIKENGIEIKKPRFYISAAETLDMNSKNIITSVFGKNIRNIYGAVEFNTIAWQEDDNPRMRISHGTNYIELYNNGVLNDSEGNCVITDLEIRSFPLIRYNLGDYLFMSRTNGVRFIDRIQGRLDDWIVFKDGSRKSWHLFYEVMEKRQEVMQFRIVQESTELIRIDLVKATDSNISEIENVILNELNEDLGDKGVLFKFNWLEKLPPDPNGKSRMVINLMNEPK